MLLIYPVRQLRQCFGATALIAGIALVGCSKAPPAEPTPASPPQTNNGAGAKVLAVEGGKLVEKKGVDLNPQPVGPPPEQLGEFPNAGQLLFAGGATGVFAHLGWDRQDQKVIDIFATASGKKLFTLRPARVMEQHSYALRADGKRIARFSTGWSSGNGAVTIFDSESERELTQFKLEAEGKPQRRPTVVAGAFITPERFMVVRSNGGFDVHDTSSGQHAFGCAGTLVPPKDPIGRDDAGFSLAENGRLVALFDGTGFTFYDPTTGKPTGKTDRLKGTDAPAVWGTALRPDGSRLAATFRTGDRHKGTDTLYVWDTATGKLLSETAAQVSDPYFGALAWCGPDHLIVGGANGNSLELWAGADAPKKQTMFPTHTMGASGNKIYRLYPRRDKTERSDVLIRIDLPAPEWGPKVWLYSSGYARGPRME